MNNLTPRQQEFKKEYDELVKKHGMGLIADFSITPTVGILCTLKIVEFTEEQLKQICGETNTTNQ